jgi:hypothetical protein
VIVEDPDLLLEQISEIATQLSQANHTLTQNESHVRINHITRLQTKQIGEKLEKLAGIITVECEYLG